MSQKENKIFRSNSQSFLTIRQNTKNNLIVYNGSNEPYAL